MLLTWNMKQRKAAVKKVEVEEDNSVNSNRGNNNMNMDNEVDCISGATNKKILQSEHIDSKGAKPVTRIKKVPVSRNKDI
jgi:hypothetical protein